MTKLRKYDSFWQRRRLKELFMLANLHASQPDRKARVKMPVISIQKRQDLDS